MENVDPIEDKEKVVELEQAEDAEQAETKNENDEISSDVNSASVEVEKQNDSTSKNNLEETSHTGQGEEKSKEKINSGNEEPIEQGQESKIEDEEDTLDSKNNENGENAKSNDDIDNSDSKKEESVNQQAVVSDVNQDDKENTHKAEHENAAKLESNVGHADGIENGMDSNKMQRKAQIMQVAANKMKTIQIRVPRAEHWPITSCSKFLLPSVDSSTISRTGTSSAQ